MKTYYVLSTKMFICCLLFIISIKINYLYANDRNNLPIKNDIFTKENETIEYQQDECIQLSMGVQQDKCVLIPIKAERNLLKTKLTVRGIELYEKIAIDENEQFKTRKVIDPELQQKIESSLKSFDYVLRFADLEDIALEIVNDYFIKNQGYLTPKTYIPPQKVVDGIVHLYTLVGVLGDVKLVNQQPSTTEHIDNLSSSLNQLKTTNYQQYCNSKSELLTFFGLAAEDSDTANNIPVANSIMAYCDLINQPLKRNTAESILLKLNESEGYAVKGTITAGEFVGQSTLIIQRTEKPQETTLFYDNAGSNFTGKTRIGAKREFRRILNEDDSLSALIYASEMPDGVVEESVLGKQATCCNGAITYKTVLDKDYSYFLGFELAKSDYDIGNVDELDLATFNFKGETVSARTFVSYLNSLDRASRQEIIGSVSLIQTKSERFDSIASEDRLVVLDLAYQFDFKAVDDWTFGFFDRIMGDLRISTGKLEDGVAKNSRLEADPDFTKLNYAIRNIKSLNNSFLSDLRLTLTGQYTLNQLVSVQQMGIGGPANVRAYPTGSFLADSGNILQLEVFTNNLVNKKYLGFNYIQPFIFSDYAAARVVEAESFSTKKVRLGGYGIGMQLGVDDLFNLSFSVAKAFGSSSSHAIDISEGGRGVTGQNDYQAYVDIRFAF